MIRLFVALSLDEITRSLLDGLGLRIPGARPVHRDQLHLTLRFIGEVEGTHYHDIREQLQLLEAPAITLSIRGVGHFPPRGRPRVIWAGVEPAGDVMILRNKVNRLLLGAGVEPDRRKFHPHITLARLNNSPAKRVARFLAEQAALQYPAATISRVDLYSSILTKAGAQHTIEQSYPLTL